MAIFFLNYNHIEILFSQKNFCIAEKYDEWIDRNQQYLEDDKLIDLVRQCLMHKPKQRPGKKDLIDHDFFQPICLTKLVLFLNICLTKLFFKLTIYEHWNIFSFL